MSAPDLSLSISLAAYFWTIAYLVFAHKKSRRAERLLEQIREVDRNARAYGWEIGRGRPMVAKMHSNDPDNPFLAKDWRERIEAAEDES